MRNLLLVFLMFLIGTSLSFASHSMGADLTYEHITGNTYRVTLKFYRDCSGITAPNQPIVEVLANGCPSTTISLNQVGYRILPTTCGSNSTCYGGSIIGAEEYTYQSLVTLNQSCTDYKLSWELCCRNAAITTLQSPNSHSFHIDAELKSVGLNNNSPEFTSLPVIYVGVGQQVTYNHGVTESDGDLLVFSLVDGLDAPGVPVNYQPGLSGTQPLITSGPVTINSQTGQVVFTPSTAQVGIISVLVEEYRNGIKIGEVTRDMQIIVAANSNTPPIVSGVNGTATSSGTTGPYTATVQAGSTLCFNVAAYDAESHAIILTATTPLGATFTSLPGTNAGQFCWTPTASDIGTHLLSVFTLDNGCPIRGSSSYVYQIEVLGSNGQCSGSISTTINGGTVDFQYTGPAVISYDWDFGDGNSSSNPNPTYTYSAAGTYSVQLTTLDSNNSVCVYATIVVIHNTGTCNAAFTYDSDFFYPDYVTSTATYFWDFGDGTTSTQVQPPNNLAPGTWTVCLSMVNCADTCFSCQVITIPAPCDGEISSTALSHFTYQFELINNTQPVTSYLWEFGDGNTSTQAAPTYTYTTAGTYIVTLNTLDSLGNQCTYIDSLIVCPSTGICDATFTYSNGTLTANDQTNTSYYWYSGNQYIGNLPVQPLNYQQGTYLVCLNVSTALGDSCTTCDTIVVPQCTLRVYVGGIDASCGGACDGSASAGASCGVYPYAYTWSNGATTNQITGLCAGTYTVTASDAQGNTVVDVVVIGGGASSLNVNVVTTPESSPGANDGSATATAAGGTAPYTYQWSTGSTAPVVSGLSAGFYCVTVTDANGCFAIDCDSIWTSSTCDASFTYTNGVLIANDQNNPFYRWFYASTYIGIGNLPNQPFNNQPGSYNVCLNTGNSYQDTCITCQVIVIPQQGTCDAGFTYTNGVFTANDLTNVNYYWNFGDGNTGNLPVEQHTYNQQGTYLACLEVISALGDSCMTCDTILVAQCPLQIYTYAIDASCGGTCDGTATVSGTCGVAPYTYNWSNGQTGYQITGLCPGTYVVTATDAQGNTANGTVVVSGASSLNVNVTTTPESSPGANNGSATATVAGGTAPYTFTWSTGNVTAVISGLSAGSYCVTVTDANGCSAVDCDSVLTASNCDASFTYTNGVLIANDQNNPFYYWFYGNTYIGIGNLPVQPFNNQPGSYNVCLNTGNSYQDTCITCQIVVIPQQGACDASFTHVNGVFTANDLTNKSFFWNFGDGNTGNLPVEQHTYGQSGTYVACLEVITALGDSCMRCDTIVAQVPPSNCDAGFTYNNGLFAADVVNSQNDYHWDFGDGTGSTQPIVQHGYAPGTYLACLEVITAQDTCKECETIVVGPQVGCNADFSYFNGLFTAHDLNNKSYFWDFGDGTTGNQAVEQHGYAPGTYLACLYVETALSDSCMTCDTIYVNNFNISGVVQRNKKGLVNGVSVGLNGPGDPFAGLTVLLEDLNGNQIAKVITNQQGQYEFKGFAYGDYIVRLDAGLIAHKGERVTIDQVAPTLNLDFTVSQKNSIGLKQIGMDVFPNPTANTVTVQLVNTLASPSIVILQNGSGEVVLKKEVYLDAGEQFVTLDLHRLPAGIYFVAVQNEALLARGKVIKVTE